jgi:hypothetical protein
VIDLCGAGRELGGGEAAHTVAQHPYRFAEVEV